MVKEPNNRPQKYKRSGPRVVDGVEYWKHRGPEDVYYQRESQTTWWTVLGGVAVAALLTRLENVWALVQSGDWYYLLYVAISALVILLAWLQISWGVLVIRWRISLAHTLWVYITGLILSFMSLSVLNIPIWWLAITLLLATAIAMQFFFYKFGGWVTMPDIAQERARKNLWVYAFFILLTLSSFILTSIYPVVSLRIGFGVAGLLCVIMALIQQKSSMDFERELFKIP